MEFYVDAMAAAGGDGSRNKPFHTIQEAADLAKAGDEILVMPGIYRENVNPKNAGEPGNPVIYRSVKPLEAVISGAELLDGWTRDGRIWTARVSNRVFQDRNPYTTTVEGDWFIPTGPAHTGDLFLNGKSMYEVADLDAVRHPVRSCDSWDPEFSVYTWCAVQDPSSEETVFYANFQELDPNQETVEYSARSICFGPDQIGIGYITLSGFTVCMAATQWAPPTAFQEGMIMPHWSTGWIIEDCHIYESKCSGISLGKYLQKSNDNKWLHQKYKNGAQTQRECICLAQAEGWSKETAGSHTVRRCHIHDCGQAGIVGHLGGIFSVIEDNHIHHINYKQNLVGAEIGGIKMHAAIDVVFRHNHIHHCTRGLWLDWQAQGTRVTQNLFHHNTMPFMEEFPEHMTTALMMNMGEDLFVEVSHGPTLIDNNVMLSDRAMKVACQGAAVVHNLIAGGLVDVGIGTNLGGKTKDGPRYTPYHFPHRTEIAGFMTFLHGDMRFYNNIFLQQPLRPFMKAIMEHATNDGNCWDDGNVQAGTFRYDGYPTFEEWDREFTGNCGMDGPESDRYHLHLPVWTGGNVFLNGAKPWEKEQDYTLDQNHTISIKIEEREDGWYLLTNLNEVTLEERPVLNSEMLGMAFEPEQKFEMPDGSSVIFDRDYCGKQRKQQCLAGPFADPEPEYRKLWES